MEEKLPSKQSYCSAFFGNISDEKMFFFFQIFSQYDECWKLSERTLVTKTSFIFKRSSLFHPDGELPVICRLKLDELDSLDGSSMNSNQAAEMLLIIQKSKKKMIEWNSCLFIWYLAKYWFYFHFFFSLNKFLLSTFLLLF